jgi:hypothetical protein
LKRAELARAGSWTRSARICTVPALIRQGRKWSAHVIQGSMPGAGLGDRARVVSWRFVTVSVFVAARRVNVVPDQQADRGAVIAWLAVNPF